MTQGDVINIWAKHWDLISPEPMPQHFRKIALHAWERIQRGEDGAERFVRNFELITYGLTRRFVERADRAARLRQDGASLRAIGRSLGISGERVRQMLKKREQKKQAGLWPC